jgi:dTDP-4-dehydrorhamnose 3,5-epimerase
VIFKETQLRGAFLIEPEQLADQRGFFARSFCVREFEAHGIDSRVAQCNISYNAKKATLRGMHYQAPPHAEVKLVRCTRGALYDVIIDLRAESATYLKSYGTQLDSDNRRMLLIPEGFAHGFITLEDRTEVFYQMSEFFDAGSARGVRWDDPAFGIRWPIDPQVISERDRTYPDFMA